MGDRNRLPKWAQAEIDRLEANVDYWKAKALVGPEGSDTFIHGQAEGEKPLGKGTEVRFGTDRFKGLTARLLHDGTVRLSTSGGDGIFVLPSASNSVYVGLLKHGWNGVGAIEAIV